MNSTTTKVSDRLERAYESMLAVRGNLQDQFGEMPMSDVEYHLDQCIKHLRLAQSFSQQCEDAMTIAKARGTT